MSLIDPKKIPPVAYGVQYRDDKTGFWRNESIVLVLEPTVTIQRRFLWFRWEARKKVRGQEQIEQARKLALSVAQRTKGAVRIAEVFDLPFWGILYQIVWRDGKWID